MSTEKTMEPDTAQGIDIQFRCLELTLLSLWNSEELPQVFVTRPKEWISETVHCWWDLTIESCCLINELKRTNWQRNIEEGEVESMTSLFERIKIVRAFINYDRTMVVRRLNYREVLAIEHLGAIVSYFQLKEWEHIQSLVRSYSR